MRTLGLSHCSACSLDSVNEKGSVSIVVIQEGMHTLDGLKLQELDRSAHVCGRQLESPTVNTTIGVVTTVFIMIMIC